MENRIAATLSVADCYSALNAITKIRTLLPLLIDLISKEHQSLPKIGDKSREPL